jgi:hypothetical protein
VEEEAPSQTNGAPSGAHLLAEGCIPVTPVRTYTMHTCYLPFHALACSLIQIGIDLEITGVCTLAARVHCSGSLARVCACPAARTSSPLRL